MQVLSYNEAAERLTICRRQLERMIEDGEGPRVTQISERRVGIIEDDLVAWIMSRRKVPAAMMHLEPLAVDRKQ